MTEEWRRSIVRSFEERRWEEGVGPSEKDNAWWEPGEHRRPSMARVTVEDCLLKVENRFALVHLASSRARHIRVDGRDPMVKAENKECVVALREVAAGHVYFNNQIQDVLEGKVQTKKGRR